MMMPLPVVRGGLAISGIYDLEPIRLNYLNEKLKLDTDEADRNSPFLHFPAKAGELIVAYGTGELPNCAASRLTMAARGPGAAFPALCSRSRAPIISRFWRRSHAPTAN